MTLIRDALAVIEGLVLIGVFIGWWKSERRSSLAEHAATRAERRAERYQDEARQARRDTADAYQRLAQYVPAAAISEADWFADGVREVLDPVAMAAPIDAKFQTFLNDFDTDTDRASDGRR